MYKRQIYDGVDDNASMIDILSGSAIPVVITSSSNQMFIKFTSDDYQSNSDGWEASYSSMHNSLFIPRVECGDHVLDGTSGSFNDGSGTNGYNIDLDCSWLIQAEEGHIIDLSFSSFDIQVKYDLVKVYDGNDETARLLGSYSGDEIPPLITSSGNELFITFTSNEFFNRNGWEANYETYSVQGTGCSNAELTAASGTIEDGSGSSDYENDLSCSWSINVEDDKLILLDFIQFDTEFDADSLTIYDGEDENATIIGSFSGTEIPTKLLSSTSQLYITFTTNESTTSKGWKLSYESVENEPITGCGETILTDGSGSFSDGSGILNYENNLDCSWLIEVDPDSLIVLTVSELDIEAGADYLKIYNMEDGNPVFYRSVTVNTTLPLEIISKSNALYITFTTNESGQNEGWTIDYHSIENVPYTGCGNTYLTDNSATFTDGSGSLKYENDLRCTWTITVDEDSVVQLSFSEFNVESDQDFVKIYDGLNDEGVLIASYTGYSLPLDVQSSGNSLYVVFETDEMTRAQGWTAHYSSEIKEEAVICGHTVLDDREATFSDGSAFDDYQADLSCSWSIEVHPDSLVYLTFSEFNTELNFDYVKVYDGEDEFSDMIGAFSGVDIPSDIISSTNHLYITFETDDGNNRSGWEASYETYNVVTYTSNTDLISDEMIKVHPNPFSDKVVIDINEAIPDLNIQLIDIQGNLILSQEVEANSLQLTLPLESLEKGVYLLVLSTDDRSSTIKLIK